MTHYFHSIPGRLRVRTPPLKQPGAQERLKVILDCHDGVTEVRYNPLTGSVTVNYDVTRTDEKTLLRLLRDGRCFDPQRAITNDQYIHRAVSKATGIVSKAFCGSLLDSALGGTPLAALGMLI